MKQITSLANPLIKAIVALHNSQERRAQKRFLVEGLRANLDFCRSQRALEQCFVTHAQLDSLLQLGIQGEYITLVSEPVMRKISQATTPSGIIGVYQLKQKNAHDFMSATDQISSGLVLAQIQDPGNMGTLIRTAVALNRSTLIVISGSTDPFSYKVIQASAGAVAHADIYEMNWQKFITIQQEKLPHVPIIGLVVTDGKTPQEITESGFTSGFIVVGNEARGLTQEQEEQCDTLMTLPMPSGKTESLNAAVAGSIALYLLSDSKKLSHLIVSY